MWNPKRSSSARQLERVQYTNFRLHRCSYRALPFLQSFFLFPAFFVLPFFCLLFVGLLLCFKWNGRNSFTSVIRVASSHCNWRAVKATLLFHRGGNSIRDRTWPPSLVHEELRKTQWAQFRAHSAIPCEFVQESSTKRERERVEEREKDRIDPDCR